MGFVNSFLSYLLVVIIFAVIAIAGVFAGKALRKRKDAKLSEQGANGMEDNR